MKHIFIMNPAAGKGKIFHQLIDDIHKVCDRRRVDYDIHVTEKIGESTTFVKGVCSASSDPVRFYACGGDGTIKEVVSGMVGFDHAELAIIPMGTGNDFVKNFEHTEMLFNIDAQLDSETRKIDLLKYNGKYGINIINCGFDCEVAKQVVYNRRSVFLPKSLAYPAGIVQKITQFNNAIVSGKMYVDGNLQSVNQYQACVFANGRYYGGGYFAAPASQFDDGVLDCCLIHKIPLMTFVKILGDYKDGKHLTNPQIHSVFDYRKCNEMELYFDKPTDISVDGEIETINGKLTISVAKQIVNLSLPKACQPIPVKPADMRAANKLSKR